jgi:hypothetical protein
MRMISRKIWWQKKRAMEASSMALASYTKILDTDSSTQASACIRLTLLASLDTLRDAVFLWIEPLEAVF